MPQSLSSVLVHVIFSTKERRPFLSDRETRLRLHQQLGGTSNALDCQSLIVGGAEDHIHLLGVQARTITLADWIKELKRATSHWIKEEYPQQRAFSWQAGYGAFSVSQSQVASVRKYIDDQEEHHKKVDFVSEFKQFLERHQVPYDERYVWD